MTPTNAQSDADTPRGRVHQRFIPDVPVLTHEGVLARVYSDLIRDRVIMVNFMSILEHATNPVTANLSEVARLLGPLLGTQVRMLSVTVDPANDTPEALCRFARQHRAPPGWLFLTGDKPAVDALRNAFFRHGTDPEEAEAQRRREAFESVWGGFSADPRRLFCSHPSALQDCSAGLIRYGNDALDLWGSVPACAEPGMIVQRLSWIVPRPARLSGTPLRRGGPANIDVIT
jgi:hypothetical protein